MAQAASTAAKKRKKGKSRAKDHALAPPKSGGVTRQLQNLQHTRQLQNLQQVRVPPRRALTKATLALRSSLHARAAMPPLPPTVPFLPKLS